MDANLMPDALRALLAREARLDLVYGENDCALFAASVLMALGGPDLAAPLRGQYNSKKAALILLRRAGGLRHVVDSAFVAAGGGPGLNCELAAGLIRRSLAARLPSGWWVAKARHGVIFAPPNTPTETWSCPLP